MILIKCTLPGSFKHKGGKDIQFLRKRWKQIVVGMNKVWTVRRVSQHFPPIISQKLCTDLFRMGLAQSYINYVILVFTALLASKMS